METYDERLTTVTATRLLREGGAFGRDRVTVRDASPLLLASATAALAAFAFGRLLGRGLEVEIRKRLLSRLGTSWTWVRWCSRRRIAATRGCRRLSSFINHGRRVPCRSARTATVPLGPQPSSTSSHSPAPGESGERGSVLLVALDSAGRPSTRVDFVVEPPGRVSPRLQEKLPPQTRATAKHPILYRGERFMKHLFVAGSSARAGKTAREFWIGTGPLDGRRS